MLLCPHALGLEGALLTHRLSRMTHLSSQANGQQVKPLHESRISWQNLIQPWMRVASFRYQSHAAHHTAYVRIGREDRAIKRKEKNNPRGFWPHTWQLEEPMKSILQREIIEKLKIESATCLHYSIESFFDRSSFLLMQAANLDCRSDVSQRRSAHGFECLKPRHERPECSIPIDVVCVLRKNSEHEIIDRIMGPDSRSSVAVDQSVDDPQDLCMVVHSNASIEAEPPRHNWCVTRSVDIMNHYD